MKAALFNESFPPVIDGVSNVVLNYADILSRTPETEAVEALMGIGYSKAEAVSAVSAVSALADTAEDLTLMAVKRLAM